MQVLEVASMEAQAGPWRSNYFQVTLPWKPLQFSHCQLPKLLTIMYFHGSWAHKCTSSVEVLHTNISPGGSYPHQNTSSIEILHINLFPWKKLCTPSFFSIHGGCSKNGTLVELILNTGIMRMNADRFAVEQFLNNPIFGISSPPMRVMNPIMAWATVGCIVSTQYSYQFQGAVVTVLG